MTNVFVIINIFINCIVIFLNFIILLLFNIPKDVHLWRKINKSSMTIKEKKIKLKRKSIIYN